MLLFCMFIMTLSFIGGGVAVFLAVADNAPPLLIVLRAKLRAKFPRVFSPPPRLFMLDHDGIPTPAKSLTEWSNWWNENHHQRNVQTSVNTYRNPSNPKVLVEWIATTVFLGVNHRFQGSGPPLIYETIVQGGLLDGEVVRYASEVEALEGHRLIQETHSELVKALEVETRLAVATSELLPAQTINGNN